MMETITFDCEVITPMFLAGADPDQPEIRPASIKGALRFWWRAMHGHLVSDDGNLATLKKKEAEIFGGTDKGQGRSQIVIRVLPPFPEVCKNKVLPYHQVETYNKKYRINILDYLAYGISTYDKNATNRGKNLLKRNYINAGQKFKIQIGYPKQLKSEIAKALFLLSEFGGLGSKSRNGFGSFKIISDNKWLEEVNLDELNNIIVRPYSSFSENSKVYDFAEFDTWDKALAQIGEIYQYARENIEEHHNYNLRSVISAPIIVREKGISAQKSFLDRHAKPYFLHVSKKSNGKYFGTILSMPYDFLAKNSLQTTDRSVTYKNAIKIADKLIFGEE